MKRYGVCDCGKWCEAPAAFRETLHFMMCSCGKYMFLTIFNPKEAGHRDDQVVVPVLVNHGGG